MGETVAKRWARLGTVGTVLATAGGAFVGFLVQSGSLEAAAQVLATGIASKGVWGGAGAAAIMAAVGKHLASSDTKS